MSFGRRWAKWGVVLLVTSLFNLACGSADSPSDPTAVTVPPQGPPEGALCVNEVPRSCAARAAEQAGHEVIWVPATAQLRPFFMASSRHGSLESLLGERFAVRAFSSSDPDLALPERNPDVPETRRRLKAPGGESAILAVTPGAAVLAAVSWSHGDVNYLVQVEMRTVAANQAILEEASELAESVLQTATYVGRDDSR